MSDDEGRAALLLAAANRIAAMSRLDWLDGYLSARDDDEYVRRARQEVALTRDLIAQMGKITLKTDDPGS